MRVPLLAIALASAAVLVGTTRADQRSACTVDADCAVGEKCRCVDDTDHLNLNPNRAANSTSTIAKSSTTEPGSSSPAAPLARTTLSGILSFAGLVVACAQPAAAAAEASGDCYCQKGAATNDTRTTTVETQAQVRASRCPLLLQPPTRSQIDRWCTYCTRRVGGVASESWRRGVRRAVQCTCGSGVPI